MGVKYWRICWLYLSDFFRGTVPRPSIHTFLFADITETNPVWRVKEDMTKRKDGFAILSVLGCVTSWVAYDDRYVLSHSSECWKTKFKSPWEACGESSLAFSLLIVYQEALWFLTPKCITPIIHCPTTRMCPLSTSPHSVLFYRDTSHVRLGSNPIPAQLGISYMSSILLPDTVTLWDTQGTRLQYLICGWQRHSLTPNSIHLPSWDASSGTSQLCGFR